MWTTKICDTRRNSSRTILNFPRRQSLISISLGIFRQQPLEECASAHVPNHAAAETIGFRLQTPRSSRQFPRSRSALRGREGKSREVGCDHKACRKSTVRALSGPGPSAPNFGRRKTYLPAFSATISSRPLPSRYASLSVELYKSPTANPHAENMRLNSAIV